MDDIKDLINGQHALKKELIAEIAKLQKNMDKRFEAADNRFNLIDARLDKLGSQMAYLEDDVPTREEHDTLEKQVKEIKQRLKN